MQENFVIRTYDLNTLKNYYIKICGDAEQIRRNRIISATVYLTFFLAGVLFFLATGPVLRRPGFWLMIMDMLFLLLMKRQDLKRLENTSKDTMYSFGERGYTVFENGKHERHDYSEFVRLREDKHCFILLTGRVSGCYLPKADFEEGDAEAFAEFITRKTGLPMERKN